jgi:hypothetical protein
MELRTESRWNTNPGTAGERRPSLFSKSSATGQGKIEGEPDIHTQLAEPRRKQNALRQELLSRALKDVPTTTLESLITPKKP